MALKVLLRGLGIGAGAMYFWDPQLGRRRRALVLDQMEHFRHAAEDYLDRVQRDLSNRAAGVVAESRAYLDQSRVDDPVLTARVRSKVGRYCSHPHAIRVQAADGHVVLGGPILANEVEHLLGAVRGVRGVRTLENQLEVSTSRGQHSALQGGNHRTGEHYDFLQENWSPATRALSQLAGLALIGTGLIRHGLPSKLLGVAGLGLVLRGSTNHSLGQLVGVQVCPQRTRIQRTVMIHAPAEKVWELITDPEQMGRLLPNVRSVEKLDEGHYRWGLAMPGGQELEVEERVIESVPQERFSWECVANHAFPYCGAVSLQRDAEELTRVNLHLEYVPPGGILGEALASLFGVDAESQFQQAVVRVKSFLETGNPPRDLHEVRSGPSTGETQTSG